MKEGGGVDIEVIKEVNEKDLEIVTGENFENSSSNQENTTIEEFASSKNEISSKNSPRLRATAKFNKKSSPQKLAKKKSKKHLYCKNSSISADF